MDLTHASFFSGVGGLDLGLERAGWRTVSFSEIDPYACAVLAERWPGVPNLGSIVDLADGVRVAAGKPTRLADGAGDRAQRGFLAGGAATLWSGGFPCQDLSVAGKRRGMGAGTRSGLAFAFLDLVAVHRPAAVLLENVPGLLSSHRGRDMAALISALVELGYGVGYRILDARYFGVPQRRRRVFILGLTPGGRAGAERAAEVLSVGSRCRRHPPTGIEAGADAADGTRPGVDIARTVVGTAGKRHDEDIDTLIANALDQRRGGADDNEAQANHLISTSPDSDRVRAPDGLAGRLDDRLPLGLDSHRYRCCGNGVVADVAEWIGLRLREALA